MDELLLKPTKDEEIGSLHILLEKFDSVTKSLQNENNTVEESRSLIDAIGADFPECEESLEASGDIFLRPHSEFLISKLQNWSRMNLREENKQE